MTSKTEKLASSFRDPSGFLFTRNGVLYRQVNHHYQSDYEQLMQSGLYDELVKEHLLVPHQEVDIPPSESDNCYKVIQPELLPFISYPYEWSFSQLKNAALTTLAIQKKAFEKGMALKDATAYNIQFHNGRSTLIDTLSFETYQEGKPWFAYRQFCQHFLGPLALMAYKDARLNQLLRVYLDGIPLDLVSTLLPTRTRISPSMAMHIHIHASAQKKYADKTVDKEKQRQMGRNSYIGIIESLETAVRKLNWQPEGEWTEYYSDTNYSTSADQHKADIIKTYLADISPKTVWDLGGNTGRFSRIASDQGIFTLSCDIDAGAVERNYLETQTKKEETILPLVMDLTNPSSGLGWHHQERESLADRGPADALFALALIHHLAIGNNVPLAQVADYFSDLGQWLIIEFVPKSDSQVKRLLATRADIFPNYTPDGFEQAFSSFFKIHKQVPIRESDRVLYLMERISG